MPNITENQRRLFEAGHHAALDSPELRTRQVSMTLPDGQLMIARELLEAAHLNVVLAGDGREALDVLEADAGAAISLVLMDLQLPEMDGYEATSRLRADPRFAELPIIAMTAHAMSEERAQCLRLGMNDHISKPIAPGTLHRVLEQWLA